MNTNTEHGHWFSDKESAEKRLKELGDDYTILTWGESPENPKGYAVVNEKWLIEEMKKEGKQVKEKDGYHLWEDNIA